MKKKTKKKKKAKKPTDKQIEQAIEDEDDDEEEDNEFIEGYGAPEPSKIIKVFDLGLGAIGVLRSDHELVYMNPNLKFPIAL